MQILKILNRLYVSWLGFGHTNQISFSAKLRGSGNITMDGHCKVFAQVTLDTSASPYLNVFGSDAPCGTISLGENVKIKEFCLLYAYGGRISIGNESSLNPFTVIYGHGGVEIGSNVLIAANSTIVSSNHIFSSVDLPVSAQGLTSKGIRIEDDVWIGANVTILDGVTIGKGSIIAAGSVVNSNVEANSVYAGVPAKKVGDRGRRNNDE